MHFMSIANKSFCGIGANEYLNGMASFLRTTANRGFSIKCLYMTVGVGYRRYRRYPPLPPAKEGARVGCTSCTSCTLPRGGGFDLI